MVSLWSQEHGTGEAWNKPCVLSVVYIPLCWRYRLWCLQFTVGPEAEPLDGAPGRRAAREIRDRTRESASTARGPAGDLSSYEKYDTGEHLCSVALWNTLCSLGQLGLPLLPPPLLLSLL